MLRRAPLLALAAALSLPALASAHEVVDARARLLQSTIDNPRALAPLLNATVDEDGFAATIRLRGPLDPALRTELEKDGVSFFELEGELVSVGDVYTGRIAWSALDTLAAHKDVVRIEAAWRPLLQRPLVDTAAEIGAHRAHQLAATGGFTGEGVLIADLDTPFDIFHPAFFFADGARRPWIDVDGDGTFGAGDAIDWSQDGVADDDEIVGIIDSVQDWYDAERRYRDNDDGELQPGLDYAFHDFNGNGVRDFGTEAGFDERAEGYGEPMFVADDVDGDGVVDPDEPFVMLLTSKIRALGYGSTVWRRGQDLIRANVDDQLVNPDFSAVDLSHGTGVGGILAGGQVGHSTYLGVAPNAELLSLSTAPIQDADPQLIAFEIAEREGADILLHEFSSWNWTSLDGSSNAEIAMDAMHADGMLQVNPAGNLGASNKHALVRVDSGGTEVGIRVPSEVYRQTVSAFLISLHWSTDEAGAEPDFSLVHPDGRTWELGDGTPEGGVLGSGHYFYDVRDVTPRGTGTAYLVVATEDQSVIDDGTWTIEAYANGEPFELHVFVDDYYTGWGQGVGVVTPEPASTICWPATADSAIGVGAYAGSQSQWWDGEGSDPGELRYFSGRGPRLDGERGIDIAAPDDPLSAVPTGSGDDGGFGWMGRFGGTSGAGPHVAGALALMIEATPGASVDELEQRLIDSVLVEDAMGELPNARWGYGKLRILPALGLDPTPRAVNRAPELVAVPVPDDAITLDVSATTDADDDPVVFSVDIDGDGQPELADADGPRLEVAAAPGTYTVTVRAYDGQGGRDGDIVTLTVLDEAPPESDAGMDAGSGDAGTGGGGGGGGGGCAAAPTSGATPWFGLALVGLLARRRRR